jgi:hypothetical protein
VDAHVWVGECQVARRDVTAVMTTANELLEVCEEHSLPQHRTQALILNGWALACSGDVAGGWRGAWSGLGLRTYLTPGLCRLAEGCLLGRRYSEGLEQVAQALAIDAETEENWYLARLHHLRPELLQAQSRTADAAEASLRTAVENCSCTRGKRLGVARLSEPRRTLARRRQARPGGQASGIRLWLVHRGFDTPDLKDAKAMLDELR